MRSEVSRHGEETEARVERAHLAVRIERSGDGVGEPPRRDEGERGIDRQVLVGPSEQPLRDPKEMWSAKAFAEVLNQPWLTGQEGSTACC